MTFSLTTFLFEAINFVVLVFILERLVYRPLRRAIAARKKAAFEKERLADEREGAARAAEAEAHRRAEELATLRDEVIRLAEEEAFEQRARILAEAREDAEAERAHVRRLLESEREAAIGWVREVAVERGTEAAGRLLMRLAPEAVEDALWGQLVAEIARPGRLEDATEVEIRCARLPNDARRAELRAALERALGHPVELALREDRDLEAGLVVRIGPRVIDASIAGQLDAFRGLVREELEEAHVA